MSQSEQCPGGTWRGAGSAGHGARGKDEQLEGPGRKRPVSTAALSSIFNLLLCLQLVTAGINHLAGLAAVSGSFILFVLMAPLTQRCSAAHSSALSSCPSFGLSTRCGLFLRGFPKATAQPQVSVVVSQLASAESRTIHEILLPQIF